MKLKTLMATAIILVTQIAADDWKVDKSNVKIAFHVKGPFGMVEGSFGGLQAQIKFDENDLASSSFSATIEANTISTGIWLRNRDLKNEQQWFNTDKYPLIKFRSAKIEKTAAGFKAIGELTLKGISRTVEIPFTFSNKQSSGLFKGGFQVKREDFRLGKDGGSVGSEVTINIEVPVKK